MSRILFNCSFDCSIVQCFVQSCKWFLVIEASGCLNKSLNIFKYCCVLINRQINIPRKSSESLGAVSGTMWDIESNNITLFWAYLGHTKKKWYRSSNSNPQLQDGSSFCYNQYAVEHGEYLRICHQRWTTTSSLLVRNAISTSVQMNIDSIMNC